MRAIIAIIFLWINLTAAFPQGQDLRVELRHDTLEFENQQLMHRYRWNGGNIMLLEMADKRNGSILSVNHPQADLVIADDDTAYNGTLQVERPHTCGYGQAYTKATITFSIGSLQVRRDIYLYEGSAAVRHVFGFKGEATSQRFWAEGTSTGLDMIEQRDNIATASPRLAILPFNDNHWGFKVTHFREATDYHDNPVETRQLLNYRQKAYLSGNVVVGENRLSGTYFLVIKESPIGHSQALYPGFDFSTSHQGFSIHGMGIVPEVLSDSGWVRGYGYAIGLTGPEQWQQSRDLITYQKRLRPFIAKRDGMLLANTWGDRSKDSRMTAAFILEEIKRAQALGITHLQLDDGWQQGLSLNSASQSGAKWDDWKTEDWLPHPGRFPDGLEPIVAAGKEYGVEVCLWFNPSKKDDYALWERDADILIDFYQRYGIRVFKIDGMSFATKASELNLRKMFDKVRAATNDEAVFNMDVTAGQRVGYHFFQEYGNVFLENRYTDWTNYYPYRTLRNLWLLAAYMPAERLQIEFLNVERNKDRYPVGDPLAPSQAGQPYAFGTSIVGQPLAWMELTGLGNGVSGLRGAIEGFREIAPSLHECVLLPIGDEPDGMSWTGFLAVFDEEPKYLVIYKEHAVMEETQMTLPLPARNIRFLMGNQPDAFALSTDGHELTMSFRNNHQFAVFSLGNKTD